MPFDLDSKLATLAVSQPTLLMCAPDLYEVTYSINPWMEGNLGNSSKVRAAQQWKQLHASLSRVANVLLIDPVAGSPDMVFTANAGLAHGGTVVLSSFQHPERQTEEEHFRLWFASAGYHIVDLPRDVSFEGEGDALFSSDGSRLWIGHGPRTHHSSHSTIRATLDVEVTSLGLVDPRFYHLDTCFAPLEDGSLLYFPAAFDPLSLAAIEDFYSPAQRIPVTEQDALCFACNAVNIGRVIIVNQISQELNETLSQRGFTLSQLPLGEFLKAGGAAKCLVMKLPTSSSLPSGTESQQVVA